MSIYDEAASTKPANTSVEVPCYQCGKVIKTSPRYLRRKLRRAPDGSVVLCLSCLNLNRGDDVKAKIGRGVSKALSTDDAKARMSEENQRRLATGWIPANNLPTDRSQLSEISRELWQDPEYQRRQRAGMETVRTPEWKAKMSASQKIAWSDPELLERHRLFSLELWRKDGALYQKMSELNGWDDPAKLAAQRLRKQELHREWVAKNGDCLHHYRRNYVNPNPQHRANGAKKKIGLRNTRKDFVIWLFGGACECGRTDPTMLMLHHINGDGKAHRRETTSDMWRWAFHNPQKAKEILQLVCSNCHCVIHYEESSEPGAVARREARKRLLLMLGGSCQCQESRFECLQFDHIDPNSGERPTNRDVEANPSKYRILCACCNHARGRKTTNLYSRVLSFIVDGQIDIPAEEWREIKDMFDKEQICHTLGRVISEGRISLPVVQLTGDQKLSELARLATRKVGTEQALSRSYVGQRLSSHFTDSSRFKAVGKSHSAEEIWGDQTLAKKLASGLFIWGAHEGVTNTNFRRYLTSLMRIPTQFRPAAALDLIRRTGANSFYDPCGGWGDRLLAGLVGCQRVHTNDVNPRLQHDYQQMTDWVKGQREVQVTITGHDASTFVPAETFDLSFTSPPYLNTELYERDNPLQSHLQHTSLEKWVRGFLLPLWENMMQVSRVVALNLPERLAEYLPPPDDRLLYSERRMTGESGSDPVLIWKGRITATD